MTVVMEQISSSGKRRQCNSRCHSAKHPKCTCICGGKFHGSARDGTFEQKVEELRKPIQEMIDQATEVVTESSNHANQVNHDNPDNPGRRRLWTTINRDNQKVGSQGRLPLEVA